MSASGRMDGRRRNWPKRSSAGSLNCTTSPSSICAVVGLSARKPCCAGVIRRLIDKPPGQFLPVVESSGLMPEIGAGCWAKPAARCVTGECWHGDRSGWPSRFGEPAGPDFDGG